MHIYLVRHGETDWNNKFLFQGQTDIPLNKAGMRQAFYIAGELKGRKVDAVISSDLKRAFQTAEIIKKTTGCRAKVFKTAMLRERDYGNMEGKKYEFFRKRQNEFKGERDGKFFSRVNRAFKTIIKKYRGKDIVIAAHGGVVRQIVSYILGLKDYKRIRIYNASISEIFYNEEHNAFFLVLLNSVAHLPEKERNANKYHIKGV